MQEDGLITIELQARRITLRTSTAGFITESVCVYGNNGKIRNEGSESAENGCHKGFGMAGGKQSQRLLVRNTYGCHKHGNNKRKTDKQWLL